MITRYEKTFFFIAIIVVQFFFYCTVVISSISNTSIQLPFFIKKVLNSTVKEGWAFFTRDPREKSVNIYVYKNGKYLPFIKPNGDLSNFFGLSRKSREYAFEVGQLYPYIKDNQWSLYHKEDSIKFCSKVIHIKRPDLVNFLPNNFILVEVDSVPWAYARFPNRIIKNYYCIKIILY